MNKDSKKGVFASLFGSKKKPADELEAEKEFQQRIEDRIRQALILNEPTKIETVLEPEHKTVNTAEAESVPALAPTTAEPEEVIEYSYLRPSNGPDRRYRPAFRTL